MSTKADNSIQKKQKGTKKESPTKIAKKQIAIAKVKSQGIANKNHQKQKEVNELLKTKKPYKRSKYSKPYLKSLNKASLLKICKEHKIQKYSNKNVETLRVIMWDYFHPKSVKKRKNPNILKEKEGINGRPPKWVTPEELQKDWEKFKVYCDEYTITTSVYVKDVGMLNQDLNKPKVYSILDFCVYNKISRPAFYEKYTFNEFLNTYTRMRDESEASKIQAFMEGSAPSNLAALILSKHGYSTKTEVQSDIKLKGEIKKESNIDFENMPISLLNKIKEYEKKDE